MFWYDICDACQLFDAYFFRVNLCKHKKQMDQFKGLPRLLKFAIPKQYDIRLLPDLVAHRLLLLL